MPPPRVAGSRHHRRLRVAVLISYSVGCMDGCMHVWLYLVS
jgi:hypothetical protein